jgi:hypothetical protein
MLGMILRRSAAVLGLLVFAAGSAGAEGGFGSADGDDPIAAVGLPPVDDAHPLVRDLLAANPDLDLVICLAGCRTRPGEIVYARRKGESLAAASKLPGRRPAAVPSAPAAGPLPQPPPVLRPWVPAAIGVGLADAFASSGGAARGVAESAPTRAWVSAAARIELVSSERRGPLRVAYVSYTVR